MYVAPKVDPNNRICFGYQSSSLEIVFLRVAVAADSVSRKVGNVDIGRRVFADSTVATACLPTHAMPVDEDSNGCHDAASAISAAASSPSIVLLPSMTKSVSYMSSTSNSSYSTSNTGYIDLGKFFFCH